MNKILKTRLQLRKNTEAEYALIQDSFIPLKGEVLLVETSNGLRAKVGDGVKTFAQLSYTDQNLRDEISGIVVRGYLYEGKFYVDSAHTVTVVPYEYKVYIDKTTFNAYGYDSESASYKMLINIPTATSQVAGISKLYTTTGSNTDGSMTQKAITVEIGKKFVVEAGDDESLVFSNPAL